MRNISEIVKSIKSQDLPCLPSQENDIADGFYSCGLEE